jgi:subtilisin-like proprotein convertase family protein
MMFTSILLAESVPVVHLIDRGGNGGGGCFETATASGAAIPDNTPAGVCWDLNLGSAGATVVDVSVDVAATHTWIGDLEFWLNSPDSSQLFMMDRTGYAGQVPGCCGDSSDLIASAVISFADGNTYNAETMGGTILGAEFVCQTDGQCDFFPNPDGAPGLANFAGFAGENVNGTWQFCAGDNWDGDTGGVTSVTLNVTCAGGGSPALVSTKTVGTDPSVCATTSSITIPAGGGGTDVTYCYYMTNTGDVTFTNHTVDDDQLGTVLGPDFPAAVGPSNSAWFTVTTLVTGSVTNVADWTATSNGAFTTTASSTAVVTQGAPTDVSLSSFGSDQTTLTPIWLASILAIILGFGFVLRRKMAGE